MPNNQATQPVEVLWFYVEANIPAPFFNIVLKTRDPLGLEKVVDRPLQPTAEQSVAVVALLMNGQTVFYRETSTEKSLSTDPSFTMPTSLAPIGGDRGKIRLHDLCWNHRANNGWIAIRIDDDQDQKTYRIDFDSAARFAVACMTFETSRSTFLRNGNLTTARSATDV